MIGSLIKNLLILGLAGLIGGMLWYTTQIPSAPSAYEEKTDAIIVLTGGSRRLSKGFRLLKEGKGNELLITGVGKGVTLQELLAQQHPDASDDELDANAISLDYAAISTATNASAAREWMHEKHFKTARLVTANYHMPRALLEFGAAMPEIKFYPEPVFPDKEFQLSEWYAQPNFLKLLTLEYLKYVVATVKYSRAEDMPK